MKKHAALLILLTLLCLPNRALAADLDAMIGQMLMAGFRGYEVDETSPIVRDIAERNLGGVILFDYDVKLGKAERNIKSPAQVKALIASLKSHATTPLLVAVDQEGGRVQRLKPTYGFKGSPSAQELGTQSDTVISDAANAVGLELAEAGFNLDFAPVADVNVNPDSPAIGGIERSFSADPERVAQCDEIFLKGLQDHGVIGCLKHFPGHGSAGADSHLGLTDVTNTWSEAELIPYRMLVKNGSVKVIMTAHIFNAKLDPRYPATLSSKVITGILRDEIGFDGVIITDDMNMKAITEFYGREDAIRRAINAGADILLFGNNLVYDPEIVKTAHGIIRVLVDSGKISKERIAESYERIMRLKSGLTF